MVKRVLIIGNNDGLPGVKIDIANFTKFFKSGYGGFWQDNEFEIMLNPSRINLLRKIQILKNMDLDYCIVIFSGHGGQHREVVVEINGDGEMMHEAEFKNISKRQLTIFDCCRGLISESLSARSLGSPISKSFSLTENYIRARFENRILQAVEQQVTLYSCSINEYSQDTSEGGVYSKNFLFSAVNVFNEFKLVGKNHEEASYLTKKENPKQNPDAILPRCLSEQQLIISINPNYKFLGI